MDTEKLAREGYTSIRTWKEEPNEIDPDHMHPYDTYLYVLSGSIEIEIEQRKIILNAKDELVIPRDTAHNARTGSAGCTYIVAEKH